MENTFCYLRQDFSSNNSKELTIEQLLWGSPSCKT